MSRSSLIEPNGGTLVDRMVTGAQRDELAAKAASLPAIHLTDKQACDLEMIAIGAFSPLTGFVGQADFEGICKNMRLTSGVVWPIPITLAVNDDVKATLDSGSQAALYHSDGTLLAVIDVEEIYPHDKKPTNKGFFSENKYFWEASFEFVESMQSIKRTWEIPVKI